MKVEFTIDFIDDNNNLIELREDELSSKMDRLRMYFSEQDELEGSLLFIKSGQALALVHDAMWYNAINICFKFIERYLTDLKDIYKHRFYAQDNYLVFTKSTEFIKIISDDEDFPAVSYPAKEFLPVLYRCGCRIITFLEKLKCHNHYLPELKTLASDTKNLLMEKQYQV